MNCVWIKCNQDCSLCYQPDPNHLRERGGKASSKEEKKTALPYLLSSSGWHSWCPVPLSTLHLWSALPLTPPEPPGSLCSHLHHGCSLIFSPVALFFSPYLCVKVEASFHCCWGHFVAATKWRNTSCYMFSKKCQFCGLYILTCLKYTF